ncbi:MAG TPA: arginine--tRNA ligase [Microthrixaceae bacterium]|nr:arginine--tRNA ligase [Microthrixaceae bacterium]HPG15116.1 arginine--tRNA ligase [Microthrixaceae bacterium]
MRDELTAALRDTLGALGVDAPAEIHLERPARREHGEFSTNVAMATAKAAGRNPRELAQQLADALTADPPRHVTAVEVAGPGFVNFRLDPAWLHELIGTVVDAGADYGRSDVGAGTRVMVEYVSANPTGPVHAGHARGAVYGDSLARLLRFVGHDVSDEFYVNDRGVQMQTFAASLAARKAGQEPPEDGYRGQYIVDWAAEMPDGADPLEWGEAHALADQRRVLARLGVEFDTWFSERSLLASGAIADTLDDLRERDMVEEREGAVWLRSTVFGDDKDRVLVKSDGEYTYLLPDIAYHRDKFARDFDLVINVWGADHHGYVPRMKAAIQALGHDPADLEVVITQLVRLERDGEEVKISKRAGDLITLEDLIDEVGADAVRLTYLLQSVDSPQTVDLGLIVQQSNENPVFYVQMANARIASIARVAAERGIERRPLAEVDLSLLTAERELEVLRQLDVLGEVVLLAARERAPHKVTTWVRELASAVHGFYHDCPILHPDTPDELRQARWWLAEAAGVGLRVGLGLLGVSAPERM